MSESHREEHPDCYDEHGRLLFDPVSENRADLWIERYAEMLGCDPRPGAVAAAILELKMNFENCVKSIPSHRQTARDGVIREMRRTGVNCGHSSSCSVAHWFKTKEEQEANSDGN